jgi:hypothetical protein
MMIIFAVFPSKMRLYVRGLAAATVAAACGLGVLSGSAEATTYTFETLNNAVDPTFNQLLGINSGGLISGYFGSGAGGHPNKGYLLAPPYGQADYKNENFPGSAQTQVTGLNDNGTTVGFFSDTNIGPPNDNNVGFFEQNGLFRIVVNPFTPAGGVPINQLLGVNNSGIAVGFYNDAAGNSHGYTLNINTLTFSEFDVPGATSTTTTAINNLGWIAGTDVSGGVTKAFIEKGGTFRLFAVPGAMSTSFFGLNDNGIAVGDYVDSLGETNGLVFNTVLDTFITLNDPNGVLGTTLNGINDEGRIVGFYGDAVGNTDGLLATPTAIPEPATWGMMLLGFTGLGFARYRASRNRAALAA